MEAVKGVVANLQGDKTASFCGKVSGREVDFWTPSRFLKHFWLLKSQIGEECRQFLGANFGGGSFGGAETLVKSQTEKGVITKGVFSLEESPESLESLSSPESLENGRSRLCFPQSGGSLESLESLKPLESLESLEPLENGLL